MRLKQPATLDLTHGPDRTLVIPRAADRSVGRRQELPLFEQLTPNSLLIVGAVGTYVVGFLFRDQIYTRLLVVVGSVFNIIYNLSAGEVPLWDAAIGASLIALSSFQGILRLWWSRAVWAIPEDERDIFKTIGYVEPGLLRQLLRAADKIETAETAILVQEGKDVHELWYSVAGEIVLKREGQESATILAPGFVGEIAWLTDGAASATVVAKPGSVLLRWRKEDLRQRVRRSQRLENALDALIAKDLATKLAKSHPITQDADVAFAALKTL
mgnify:CR=1 FL=1